MGFLAVIMNMGIVQLPDMESYWKMSWVCQISFFVMFYIVIGSKIYFGCSMLVLQETPRKIYKIKPLLDVLLPRFQQPSHNLSIDETMVGFRGRFGSIQYMPQKPTKWRLLLQMRQMATYSTV